MGASCSNPATEIISEPISSQSQQQSELQQQNVTTINSNATSINSVQIPIRRRRNGFLLTNNSDPSSSDINIRDTLKTFSLNHSSSYHNTQEQSTTVSALAASASTKLPGCKDDLLDDIVLVKEMSAMDAFRLRQFPLVFTDEEYEEIRGMQTTRVEHIKCGSTDFEASFCTCEMHWSNPSSVTGVYGNSVLPNWIQIVGNFPNVPAGDYLVHWHVKYEQPELVGMNGRWCLGVNCGDVLQEPQQCSCCANNRTFQPSSTNIRLTYEDPCPIRRNDHMQWRRLAMGVVEVRGKPGSAQCSVRTVFGWNPRWPRTFSLCHAALLKLSVTAEVKLLLLLGMDMRKQQQAHSSTSPTCQLTKLDADSALIILKFLA